MNKIEIKHDGINTNVWITTDDEGRIKLDRIIYASFVQESPGDQPVIVLKFNAIGLEVDIEATFTTMERQEITR